MNKEDGVTVEKSYFLQLPKAEVVCSQIRIPHLNYLKTGLQIFSKHFRN